MISKVNLTVDPKGSQYVGEPSKEVDAAWLELLDGSRWHYILARRMLTGRRYT